MPNTVCPFPACEAGRTYELFVGMVEDIKSSNKDYRAEIREQLSTANNGIQGVNTNIQESIKQSALVQHSIIGLQKEFERNEKAHDILFEKINVLEQRAGGRMWDITRLLITLLAGLVIGKLT